MCGIFMQCGFYFIPVLKNKSSDWIEKMCIEFDRDEATGVAGVIVKV